MFWQEINAALALERQQALLHEAETHRLAPEVMPGAPRYREWLAHQLIILALFLAPSLRTSLRGLLSDEPDTAAPHTSPADRRAVAPPI